jgi:hypothetical protein
LYVFINFLIGSLHIGHLANGSFLALFKTVLVAH